MGLRSLLRDCTVIDIGCSTGFVALSIADVTARTTGCEVNQHLVAVADFAASYLKTDNVEFVPFPFKDFIAQEHHPDFEGDALERVLSLIEARFEIVHRSVLEYGTPLDSGRTFIVARRRPDSGVATG